MDRLLLNDVFHGAKIGGFGWVHQSVEDGFSMYLNKMITLVDLCLLKCDMSESSIRTGIGSV